MFRKGENKLESKKESLRSLVTAQKAHVDAKETDEYNIGIYNGLEIALALLEEREPRVILAIQKKPEETANTQRGRTVASGKRKVVLNE